MGILVFDNRLPTKPPKIKYYVFLYRYPNIPTPDSLQLNYVLWISTPLQQYPILNCRPLELRPTELRKCMIELISGFTTGCGAIPQSNRNTYQNIPQGALFTYVRDSLLVGSTVDLINCSSKFCTPSEIHLVCGYVTAR